MNGAMDEPMNGQDLYIVAGLQPNSCRIAALIASILSLQLQDITVPVMVLTDRPTNQPTDG